MTSKDMLEIEKAMDTPEQRKKLLERFEKDVRHNQGSYKLPGQNPTFKVTIHRKD